MFNSRVLSFICFCHYRFYTEVLVDLFVGAGIDLSSLVVVEGKMCWDLYVDGLVVSSDGNILDTLGAAIKVIGSSYLFAHLQINVLLCD